MIAYVLGAPGSGKSSLVPLLRERLAGWVILDWDALMGPAGELAGTAISHSPRTWPAYSRLVRAAADLARPNPVLLLGVCTPDELSDWPAGPWALLDCSDAERRTRLAVRNDPDCTADAIEDAASYRSLGLPIIDTTGRPLSAVAEELTTTLSCQN